MRTINIILAAILVIQGLIIIVNPASKPRFRVATVKIYDTLKATDIAQITVTDPKTKNHVTLEKIKDKWLIKEAFGFEADKSKIDEILSIIPKLQAAKEVSTNKTMFTSYHLADDNVEMELTFHNAAKSTLAHMLVGKSVIRGTFLRKKGGDTVYSIGLSISGFLFTSPSEYMADTSLKLPMGKERSQIVLKYSGNTLTFKKTKEGGPTMGPDGQMAMKEDTWSYMNAQGEADTTADATEITNFLGSLDNLMFDSVASAKDSGTFGFQKPHISIRIENGKNKGKTLLVGDEIKGKKGQRYLKVTGFDFIFAIDSFKYEKWQKTSKTFVKEEAPKSDFGADGKLPKMELPKQNLTLKVPGIVDPKKAKDSVVYPSKPKAP
ncbi:DUF4340 domain-containing protein [Myxococcota bacterium]|nr:DUF4340 domain-containing protein [Myxococcota bacterium]MBU1537121.1 DUF4340 domain-containing protein [Myxococcota bacterium]